MRTALFASLLLLVAWAQNVKDQVPPAINRGASGPKNSQEQLFPGQGAAKDTSLLKPKYNSSADKDENEKPPDRPPVSPMPPTPNSTIFPKNKTSENKTVSWELTFNTTITYEEDETELEGASAA